MLTLSCAKYTLGSWESNVAHREPEKSIRRSPESVRNVLLGITLLCETSGP